MRPPTAVRNEHRVVAEPAVPARLPRDRARPLDRARRLRPRRDQRAGRHERRAAPLVGHVTQLRQQQCGVGGVVAVVPAQRADSTPGIPFSASTSKPGVVGHLAKPVAANASRALASALSSNVAPVSGASSNGATSFSDTSVDARQPGAVEHPAQLRQLLAVAAGDQQANHLYSQTSRRCIASTTLGAGTGGHAGADPPPTTQSGPP